MTNQTERFLITEKSRNRKTGPIMVTTSESRTCPPGCAFKNDGCYAKKGPLGHLWRSLDGAPNGSDTIKNGNGTVSLKSFADLIASIKALPDGALWRHNQAGDLPGDGDQIDAASLLAIVQANAGRKGFTYTHKPVIGRGTAANRKAIQKANQAGFTINLSADTLEDADAKADLKIAPVAVVLPADQSENTITPNGRKVVVCPATQRDDVSCATCKLCQKQRDFIVGFPKH